MRITNAGRVTVNALGLPTEQQVITINAKDFANAVSAKKKTTRLPTFVGLAEIRLAEIGPRDKNINIKIARHTAAMMVEAESKVTADLVAALNSCIYELEHSHTSQSITGPVIRRARKAIRMARGGKR